MRKISFYQRLLLLSLFVAACAAALWFGDGVRQAARKPIPSTSPSATGKSISRATLTPTTSPTPSPAPSAAELLRTMSLRQKITSLLVLHPPGNSAPLLNSFVARYSPGGLILMQDNIPATIQQLNQMTGALTPTAPGLPLLIAMDEEGCQVKRLAADTFACAKQLSDQPISATYSAFRQRSELLHASGINLNFGVIADITSDRQSFIYPRVFGSDPLAVSARVAAAVQGSHPATLITIKHFPGHGETPANSHSTIPQIDITLDRWRTTDAVPFQGGIDAGADVVMFGHLTYSSVDGAPATLSRRWHEILTDDMHFQGVSITDDMVMLQQSGNPAYADPLANAIKALNAGNTMLLFVNDHGSAESHIDLARLIDGLVDAVNRGDVDQKIIDKNVMKVLQLRIKAAALVQK